MERRPDVLFCFTDFGFRGRSGVEIGRYFYNAGRQPVQVPPFLVALGHPRVLVHLAAEESGPVRALLAGDLGPAGDLGISDEEGAPSPHVTFFVSWKLKQPASSNVPRGRPRQLAPSSAARRASTRRPVAGLCGHVAILSARRSEGVGESLNVR
jgi:hypothetical protein